MQSFALQQGGWLRGDVMQDPPARRLEAISKPDRRAVFDAEAMQHVKDVFRTALRMTGDRTRAEDAVQETYLQAWKSFDRFESGTNCRAWLFKILFHCVHHQRRKWFRFGVPRENEEFLEASLAAPEPVADELHDEQILGALERIPPDYKAVILMVDVEEFAYKEASDILGIPIGTVMSRLSRGRKLLREQLVTVAASYGIGKEHHG
jgi:RNA polymerase sigma-70 factor, ECF subfamily